MSEKRKRGRVLVVDDDQLLTDMWKLGLDSAGYAVSVASSVRQALTVLEVELPDVVVTDLRLGEGDGIEFAARLHESYPTLPVILATGYGDMETAIAAIRADVYDFLSKPVDLKTLRRSLDRAISHSRLSDEVRRLRSELRAVCPPRTLLGESALMLALDDLIRRAAESDTTVLVTGETGSGKELVARELHARSPRAGGPFVAVNCAALPAALLESELFGHCRGAFTDAREDRQGLFVAAGGGTLFLDEIGDMPLPLQAKLLRVLQERRIRPVGSNVEVEVDVRVVAATHRDLQSMVEDQSLREDLYYRLNVIEVAVPPLRARGDDVLYLAQHFVTHYSERSGRPVRGLDASAAQKLLAYDWPGNVRELQNCIERAVALTQHDRLVAADLPPRIRDWAPDLQDEVELISLAALEERHIHSVLRALGGNKAHAATILGIGRKTLYRKLARYEDESAEEPVPASGRSRSTTRRLDRDRTRRTSR